MKEGAITLSRHGIILYSNSQFASLVGLPLTEVIGLPIEQFVPLQFHDTFKRIVDEGWRSDSKGEICIRSKDDQWIPFQVSVTSLQLDEGEALSIILTDLTNQKESEKQLSLKNQQLEQARAALAAMNEALEDIVKERTRELSVSREYFKFLADNIPVIVWTTLPDGYADYFNKQWYEYTGYSFEDSKGWGSKNAIHPDDVEIKRQAWRDAIMSKTAFQVEYRIRRADGEYRWHLAKAEPLMDETGNVIAWFGTSTDIERQKNELDKKDEFIGVASHELKTPLTSLKGYIQLMAQLGLPDPARLYVAKANSSLNKLQGLINDLLDVSKIKAGKLKFDMAVVNLTELLELCIDNARHIYPSHTITTELEENIFVNGNEARLEQVIMNLINNAVKYSPYKKEIIVRATKDHTMGKLSVIDFGIGLSTPDKERVFDRFFRVEDSGFNVSGLGMGLYISSEIIKQHHGFISVKSKLNKGSEFSVALPLVS
jgi:two-component system CheB/CheR fusion protein